MDKTKKLAIFDLDGTLANTLEDLANAVNNGLRNLGYPEHSINKYNQFVGNGVQKLCERALPEKYKNDEYIAKLHQEFDCFYQKHFLDNTKEYNGITSLLNYISSKGYDMAVATNKPQNFAREIVSVLFPDIHFIKVLGGCETRSKKPSPDIISEILENREEMYSEIYMIGDSNVDIETAKNAGVQSIGCVWGFRTEKELSDAGANYIVNKPAEIKNIII